MTLVISSTFLLARPKVPSWPELAYTRESDDGDCLVRVAERHTLFFARRRARLSLAFLSNSMTRFSYGASLDVSQ